MKNFYYLCNCIMRIATGTFFPSFNFFKNFILCKIIVKANVVSIFFFVINTINIKKIVLFYCGGSD